MVPFVPVPMVACIKRLTLSLSHFLDWTSSTLVIQPVNPIFLTSGACVLSLVQLSSARTLSPGLILRDYGKRSPAPPEDITRLYTYSYLTEEPTMGYLRKPIDPYDRPPKSPHFHRPQSTSAFKALKMTKRQIGCTSLKKKNP